jgi:hypothetical protein
MLNHHLKCPQRVPPAPIRASQIPSPHLNRNFKYEHASLAVDFRCHPERAQREEGPLFDPNFLPSSKIAAEGASFCLPRQRRGSLSGVGGFVEARPTQRRLRDARAHTTPRYARLCLNFSAQDHPPLAVILSAARDLLFAPQSTRLQTLSLLLNCRPAEIFHSHFSSPRLCSSLAPVLNTL